MLGNRTCVVFRFFLIVFLVGSFQSVWAEKIVGEFIAQKTCPAFQSKNKLTNPGDIWIQSGSVYTVIEVLPAADRAAWYRIIVPAASPRERWVQTNCGEAQLVYQDDVDTRCNIAGQADSYVLAMTWQPAFCETKPDKPGCDVTDPEAYQARHFTLHGLWPNKQSCGKTYGFCGEIKTQRSDFCAYPAVSFDEDTRLDEVMPSVSAGSCLERHEWHKHGTCATWSAETYFDLSADLVRQFNDAGMAYFMNRKIGQHVAVKDFMERLTAVLGAAAEERVQLLCHQGMLTEVRLSLSADLALGTDLEKLLLDAPKQGGSDCGNTFLVDAIGQ